MDQSYVQSVSQFVRDHLLLADQSPTFILWPNSSIFIVVRPLPRVI